MYDYSRDPSTALIIRPDTIRFEKPSILEDLEMFRPILLSHGDALFVTDDQDRGLRMRGDDVDMLEKQGAAVDEVECQLAIKALGQQFSHLVEVRGCPALANWVGGEHHHLSQVRSKTVLPDQCGDHLLALALRYVLGRIRPATKSRWRRIRA